MKKIFAALLMFALAAPVCLRAEGPDGPGGPDGPHHRPTVEQRLARITKALSLTPDQQTKVKAILEDTQKKMEDLAGQMKALHEKTTEDINDVLTADQKKKWAEIKEKRQERREERRDKSGETPSAPSDAK